MKNARATGRIYLLNDDSDLVAMDETYYESERILQELIAKYPDLLAGEQMDVDAPRRWLLITREMEIESDDEDVGTWSLDHLFLDQDGVPTLVEVKRSGDTRIRRNIVGQMLDYAANAVVHLPVEKIIAEFERRCAEEGCCPEEELSALLGEERESPPFWQSVKTNLEAGRIRMVFVADAIPPALRRIVEFLNEQMRSAEAVAIEIKQFEGKGRKTLVPRVVTAREKRTVPAAGKRTWDEPSLLRKLRETQSDDAASLAKALIDWTSRLGTKEWWGEGGQIGSYIPVFKHGSIKHYLFRLTTKGYVVFRFDWLCKTWPFNDDAVGQELRAMVQALPAVTSPGGENGPTARVPLASLADTAAMSKLQAIVEWMVATIKRGPLPAAGTAANHL